MAQSSDSVVTLSILDRLIDEETRISSETPLNRTRSVRILRDGVRRDLEWILNTRSIASPPDPRLRELNRSMYMFGLPDFTGYALTSPGDQAKVVRQLQNALKLFEPRLAKVRLVPLDAAGTLSRTFRFRIEALLLMDPTPEHISFDTVLQLTSGQCEVQNAGG